MARSLGPTTLKTGSVRWDSFAQSSELVRSAENGNDGSRSRMDYELGAPRHGEAIHPAARSTRPCATSIAAAYVPNATSCGSSTSGRIAVTPVDSMALDVRDGAVRHRPP